MELGFGNLFAVATVAFFAPLALGLVPRLRLPAIVLELLAGIVIGPSVLGLVEVDAPVEVLALIGLAFLLFLAGLELDVDRLRGRVLRVAVLAFALSFVLALLVASALALAGTAEEPLFVAIVLSATGLGVLLPVLKDSGESETSFGQLVIAAASIADVATIVLLSLFFSQDGSSTAATRLLLLAGLVVLAALLGLALAGAGRVPGVGAVLDRLQDTTAQIRVRGAFLLLVGLAALAAELGIELILGAFVAGAVLSLVDRDRAMTHPDFRGKLVAVGFGVFIPAFFVAGGVRFELDALLDDPSTLARLPLFLVALLVVRGLPALLYSPLLGRRESVAAGLLQATSLSFIVAAVAVGRELDVITPANGAAVVGAGVLSVVLFPAAALAMLRNASAAQGTAR